MAFSGQNGKIMLGAATEGLADITNWKTNVKAGTYDATAMGTGGWRTYVTGIKEWTGSAEANYSLETDAGHDTVQSTLVANTAVALKLYIDATHYFSGNAVITSIDYDVPADGLVGFSFDFQGQGALVGPTTTP